MSWNRIFALGVSLITDLVPIVQVSVEFSFENSVDVPLWQRRNCTVVIRILSTLNFLGSMLGLSASGSLSDLFGVMVSFGSVLLEESRDLLSGSWKC